MGKRIFKRMENKQVVSISEARAADDAAGDDGPAIYHALSNGMAELLHPDLVGHFELDYEGSSDDDEPDAYILNHPAVKADPYRSELIPTYNQMYFQWRRTHAKLKTKRRR